MTIPMTLINMTIKRLRLSFVRLLGAQLDEKLIFSLHVYTSSCLHVYTFRLFIYQTLCLKRFKKI